MTLRFAPLAIVLLSAHLAYGQGAGAIVGTVTDATGAVIPGATVTVRQTGTGLERFTTSSLKGYFVVPSLPPSSYDLEVKVSGFETFVQKGIVLQADQSLTVNARVSVANATETVTVSTAVTQVNTSTGALSQVVDEKRIVEMPLNGRNAAALTLLVAGTVQTPSNGVDQGFTKTFPEGVTISTNGSRQSQISYHLDGGNNADEFTNINQPFPFPDALQEFSVQTSNYSARHGGNAGGVVNVITKAGTNTPRGSVFEFVRHSAFNARNAFASDVDPLRRNQFGGVFGGPIRTDKTFFFVGYQGTTIRNSSSKSATVPTIANLNGDFSALLNASDPNNPLPGTTVAIVDPQTGKPFAGNSIPVDRFDRTALAVAKRLPQVTGTGQIRYIQPLAQNFHEYVTRVDHALTARDRLTFRYFEDRFTQDPQFDPNNLLSYSDSATIVSRNALVQSQHMFRGRLINDMHFSYSSVTADRTPPSGAPAMSALGVRMYDGGLNSIQNIQVRNFFTLGDDPPATFARSSYRLSDDLSWIHGRHSVSFGGAIDWSLVDVSNRTNVPGSFTFTADVTKYAPAAFLLGQLNQFVQGSGQYFSNRNQFIGFYLQDDLRVGRRLTLNLGVRYEPFLPWKSQEGRVMQFSMDAYQNGTKSKVYTNAPAGMLFPGDPGVPAAGYNGDFNNLAPRVGFAYDVRGDSKTSIRGGIGMFYDSRLPGITGQTWGSTTPFSVTVNVTRPNGPFSDPFAGTTNPFPAPSPAPSDIQFPTPVSAYGFDPTADYKVPVLYNGNISVEQQLAPGWLLRAAYVGSRGHNINEYINLNPAVYTPGSTLGTDKRRLFQPFGLVGMFLQDVDTSYDSLQLSLDRRLSKGLTLLVNYTLAKAYDNHPVNQNVVSMNINLPNLSTIPWNMPGRQDFDYGPSLFDRRHRFVASYTWTAPKPKGGPSFLRALAGDWQLAGVITAQSGVPLTIVAGVDQSQTGLNADRAVQVGSPYGGNACGTKSPCVNYLDRAAFQLPAVGTFGTVRKGSLRGPGYANWDMALSKSIPLGSERVRLQVRAEYFNVLNRVNLNDPGTSMSGATFGQIVGAQEPRIGQFSLKLTF